eukprot:m.339666 g.339666  ORF g.339666 m.339666 type:complete len:140 (+) comp18904_c0_seq1:32-451(+)
MADQLVQYIHGQYYFLTAGQTPLPGAKVFMVRRHDERSPTTPHLYTENVARTTQAAIAQPSHFKQRALRKKSKPRYNHGTPWHIEVINDNSGGYGCCCCCDSLSDSESDYSNMGRQKRYYPKSNNNRKTGRIIDTTYDS